jgi:FkbM family methyltransferase
VSRINGLVRKLRQQVAPTTREPGVATSEFFELAFGRAPNAGEVARLDALLPARRVETPAQAHRILLGFDAQSHPTTFQVRAAGASLRREELDGFKLWLDADDPAVSAVITHEHAWEQHVSDALTSALRAGSTFVDIGANVGFHTFLAASLVGPSGSVLAVEASSENCRLLQLSKAENHADNVVILPLALDRAAGVTYLSSHLGSNGGLIPDEREHLLEGLGTTVYATTLDDIAPPKIDVLKIDVEGAEFRVLEGGRKTLERDKPLLIMELSREMARRTSGVDPAAALQDLLDLGYDLFVLDRKSREPIPYESAAALLAQWDDPLHMEDLLLRPV